MSQEISRLIAGIRDVIHNFQATNVLVVDYEGQHTSIHRFYSNALKFKNYIIVKLN